MMSLGHLGYQVRLSNDSPKPNQSGSKGKILRALLEYTKAQSSNVLLSGHTQRGPEVNIRLECYAVIVYNLVRILLTLSKPFLLSLKFHPETSEFAQVLSVFKKATFQTNSKFPDFEIRPWGNFWLCLDLRYITMLSEICSCMHYISKRYALYNSIWQCLREAYNWRVHLGGAESISCMPMKLLAKHHSVQYLIA